MSERQEPIYTEKAECQDCYKCVRGCPVKAIRVEQGSATVMHDRCILCGHCVEICPVGAKRVRDDIPRVRQLLDNKESVYVSLAPSFRSEFPDYTEGEMIRALKTLGFAGVSETALGAEEVSAHTADYLRQQESGIHISTACPTVAQLIEKYHPELRTSLLPHLSPMIAHARLLHASLDSGAAIVFIGPCIAKKRESDSMGDDVAAALTFLDLRKMLQDDGLLPGTIVELGEDHFVPKNADPGRLYPVDGGMLATVMHDALPTTARAMSFSGIVHIQKALQDCAHIGDEQPVFLELLACEGGCVNGPVCNNRLASALKRFSIIKAVPAPPPPGQPSIDISRLPQDQPIPQPQFSPEAINEALHRIGKYSSHDELNCSGCGYESCRDFAVALLENKAEDTMCVSYMRKLAQKKANALIKTMPSGMVIVNERLRIVECNRRFCEIMGSEIVHLYETKPGLEDASLKKIVPFYSFFQTVLENGRDILDRDIRQDNRYFNFSIFTIEPGRFVGGILQDITTPAFRKEQIIRRTENVIKKNLSTVQQIASLLGENASETEIMLESIITSFSGETENGAEPR